MQTFDTPTSISVTIELVVGTCRITASDRTDTTVEVLPSDPASELDRTDAEQTRVEYSSGRLFVRAPKRHSLRSRGSSVDVVIELPTGSHVHGAAAVATFRCEGKIGECTLKTGAGDIRLDETGAVRLKTSLGDVIVDHVVGHADVASASGRLSIQTIDGTAAIRNSNGETRVGEITGNLRSSSANGNITVDRAHADVEAKTALGSVRIGEVVRGSIGLQTSAGELEVGIRAGTAALLDVGSRFGHVRNTLAAADGPEESDETVEVRARSSFGDIVIRRS